MKKIVLSCLIAFFSFFEKPRSLTCTPAFIVENDAAANAVITLDATKSNQGLLNYAPTTDVYIHTRVLTSLSTSVFNYKIPQFGNSSRISKQLELQNRNI